MVHALDLAMSQNFLWHDKHYFRQKKGVAMGAKYAPSVANLFMSHWEKDAIFSGGISELKFYKQHIDNIIIIWAGTQDSFLQFLKKNW